LLLTLTSRRTSKRTRVADSFAALGHVRRSVSATRVGLAGRPEKRKKFSSRLIWGSGLSGAGEPSAFPGAALLAPATQRNRDPILAVLRRVLPATGTVLEIASGTGEHAVHFAAALPGLKWQPTDRDADALVNIAAHRAQMRLLSLLHLLRSGSGTFSASQFEGPLSRIQQR
jgi:Protein of unknown function (DUF938)